VRDCPSCQEFHLSPVMPSDVFATRHTMSDLGNGSVDAMDERAGFTAVALELPDPFVRDYYCDECGPVECSRPDGNWTMVPQCSDCG